MDSGGTPPNQRAPFFSVVIPVFNREATIKRAIDSCLSQSFSDFEVVVVDDFSRDATVESVESFADARVSLVRHRSNMGVCAARNTGVAATRGMWLVMLDSDDELAPGAFGRLARRARVAGADVGNVGTQCRWDDGHISPGISFDSSTFDFPGFLRWLDTLEPHQVEWFNCIRREVFREVCYPAGRTYEGGFHLDLASRWSFQVSSDVTAYHHSDVPGITREAGEVALAGLYRVALDSLRETERILVKHGAALRRSAPDRYVQLLRGGSVHAFLLGQRRRGLRMSMRAIRLAPFDTKAWLVPLLGFVSGRLLAWVKISRTPRE